MKKSTKFARPCKIAHMKKHDTTSPSWRTPPEARPDLNFVVRDLQRTFLRVADNLRWYEQTWLGVPIWQLADDLVALQRIVFDVNPKWIVETGTKFGGSAIFFGSLHWSAVCCPL